MKKTFLNIIIALITLLTINIATASDYDFRYDDKTHINKDTLLSGRVYIKDSISVGKGVTLTIKPGTIIECENPGLCDDGNVNYSIMVEGTIVAKGTKEEPIIFTSASEKKPSAFGEIFISESENSLFKNCTFQFSHWGLHVHDSNVTVKNCVFENTFGGIRFKGDKLIILNNQFINNNTSLRFWQAAPDITSNTFKDVDTAIFIREKVKGPIIQSNKFIGVKSYFVKLGELQEEEITIIGSDFSTMDQHDIDSKIFDNKDEDYIGKVLIRVE